MSRPVVTAILMSWRRQPNMPRIIEALRAQTVPVEIWLINNLDCQGFGADRLIAYPWAPDSAGEWARYPHAARAETEYVMFQDDDFMLGDSRFVEDAIGTHAERCPDHILGVAGRGVQTTPPHYAPDVTDGYAAIVKGHFQLFQADITRRIRLPRLEVSSDIYWSLDAGAGQAVHWISASLAKRLIPLDRHGVGYEFRPGHYREREAVCAAWLKEAA